MTGGQCWLGVCFVPLSSAGQKFFGFSEFLAGLALMVLVWTIADVRYRFRVRTAPLPLQGLTFAVVSSLGLLTLLTDLWRAEQWLVPKGDLLTPASWQALLGGLFLLTFLTWTWFAFIRPAAYSQMDAKRFAQTLYRVTLKGTPIELAVIADELAYSANALIRHATDRGRLKNYGVKPQKEMQEAPPDVEAYANEILLLMADRRLCRAIVESSPGTALAIFRSIAETKKYGIQIELFAKNLMIEAISNKDSFLFHEGEGYQTGLMGYHKPLTQAMFSNYEMVETIGSLLDLHMLYREWDASQWEAYCRVVLSTLRGYIDDGWVESHSYVLYRAKGYIANAVSDLYTLDKQTDIWKSDAYQRLRVIVGFLRDAVQVLETKGAPSDLRLRIRKTPGHRHETFYDHLASVIFELIFHAASVRSPRGTCWFIQHNSVWSELFNFDRLSGNAGRVIKFKVRRLIYEEIAGMNSFPNFKGAKILGYCLNVMRLAPSKDRSYDRDSRALQAVVLAWTKKNFVWLHEYNPRIAAACLVDGTTYDVENRRLVHTSPVEGLRREPAYEYLELDSTKKDAAPVRRPSNRLARKQRPLRR